MPKRRASIAMTETEQADYLLEGHTLEVASNGPHGFPHLVAMNYAVIDGRVHFHTYAQSQKVLNLRRDPRITVMVESGEDYAELRGLVIEGQATIIEGQPELAARISRREGARPLDDATDVHLSDERRRVLGKRVVIRVEPLRVYSWDHRKLGGLY